MPPSPQKKLFLLKVNTMASHDNRKEDFAVPPSPPPKQNETYISSAKNSKIWIGLLTNHIYCDHC